MEGGGAHRDVRSPNYSRIKSMFLQLGPFRHLGNKPWPTYLHDLRLIPSVAANPVPRTERGGRPRNVLSVVIFGFKSCRRWQAPLSSHLLIHPRHHARLSSFSPFLSFSLNYFYFPWFEFFHKEDVEILFSIISSSFFNLMGGGWSNHEGVQIILEVGIKECCRYSKRRYSQNFLPI